MIRKDNNARLHIMLERLYGAYPRARIALDYNNSLELLVATMLSAQCTDITVNKVTKSLFRRYRTCEDYATTPVEILEKDIYSTGFYRNKARNIQASCRQMIGRFAGKVPSTMADLLTLPGVARKTANIVLSNAFGKIEGIPVDTHVKRIAKRLGFTEENNPDKIERDLMAIIPRNDWSRISYTLIEFGRTICKAPKPRCCECLLKELCPAALCRSEV